MNKEEEKENEVFLKWIKSPTFQLSSHEQRTNDLELYMIAKNREIYDLKAALASKQEQENKQKILIDAITEVLRVLESDNDAIVDTVWVTGNSPETLWEHCVNSLEQVTGIEYKPAEQLALDLKQEYSSSELLDSYQELNMSNYGDDDVRNLNNWAIDSYSELKRLYQQEHIESNQPKAIEPYAWYVGALNSFTTNKDEMLKMSKNYPVTSLYK